MTEENHPWSRMEGETNRWFQRFEAFRVMGPGRSWLSIYRAEWRRRRESAGKSVTPEPKKVPGSWAKYAHGFQIVERAQAWDKYLTDQAGAAIEASWRAKVMGPTEVLARLSEQAQTNPARFMTEKEITIPGEHHKDGSVDPDMTIKSADLDWDEIRKNGHLIKKISFTQYGPVIEMYSVQEALQLMGKHWGQFNDRSLQIDLSKLTDEQLARLAAGEDIVHVLATPGAG